MAVRRYWRSCHPNSVLSYLSQIRSGILCGGIPVDSGHGCFFLILAQSINRSGRAGAVVTFLTHNQNGCAADMVGLSKGHSLIRSSSPIDGDKQYSNCIWSAWAGLVMSGQLHSTHTTILSSQQMAHQWLWINKLTDFSRAAVTHELHHS